MSSTSFSLEGSFGDLSTVVLRAGESNCVIDVEESCTTVESHSCQSPLTNNAEAEGQCQDGFEDVLSFNGPSCTPSPNPSKMLISPHADVLASLRYAICK